MVPQPDDRIRKARGSFAAMAGAYALGTFNDNFFKQAVMLLAVTLGRKDLQGHAGIAFTLPFVLFAAPAGWVADRFPKRGVVLGAKLLELAAALVGAFGLLTGHLGLMVGMVGLMGLQATFFSPALNGSIPELFPAGYVTRANALLRVVVTAGILVGISLSGFILDLPGTPLLGASRGRAVLALCVVGVALLGLVVSLGIPRRPAADPARPFPRRGPLDTLAELGRIWRDRQLGRVLAADVFVWSAGVFQLLVINTLGKEQFRLTDTGTSLLVASQLVGMALGGLLAGRLASGPRWQRVLPPAGLGMALSMGAVAGAPFLPPPAQVPSLYLLVGLGGLFGGLFLIPCESFLQIRPAPERKGAVWAAANCAAFLGMAAASLLYIPLKGLKPSLAYGGLGAAALAFTLWLALELRREAWRALSAPPRGA